MKKDVVVPKPEWWKHLRNYAGKRFWKKMRQAYKKLIQREEE